ncbi:hypothetical protein AAG570_004814 [Ranatra chinensis]|uniref:Uncharacterized protein n=1 Tax=Ranatra chinensis TaxID=642074 RepID=A0ABD0Y1Y6_9HEMI
MASKRRNIFQKNKTQETTENGTSSGSHQHQGEGHHQQGGQPRWRHHQQRHHSLDSNEARLHKTEDEVRNTTVTFNEGGSFFTLINDEYTKITTPRQDMLFKKGYLNKKRQTQDNTNNNTTADSHSQVSDCMEGEQYICDDIVVPPPALTQYIYPTTAGYLDPNGLFYVNSEGLRCSTGGYEVYDPYTGNVTVIVGGPPLQPAMHPEWMSPTGHLQQVPQHSDGHSHMSGHKPQSPDSQNCCSPAESSVSGGTCSSPQPQVLSSSSPLEEDPSAAAEAAAQPSERPDLEEMQHSAQQAPLYHHHHQYLYPGYVFGAPLYTMNGLSVQQGLMVGGPPQPAPPLPVHQQQRVTVAPSHMPPVESPNTAPAGFYTKQKRKKRRRRKRGGVTDEGSESSCEEQQARCCGEAVTAAPLAACGSGGDSATATCSGSDSGSGVATNLPDASAIDQTVNETPRSPSPASSLKESADSGVQSGDNSSGGGVLGEARSPSPTAPQVSATIHQSDDTNDEPAEFPGQSEDSDNSTGTEQPAEEPSIPEEEPCIQPERELAESCEAPEPPASEEEHLPATPTKINDYIETLVQDAMREAVVKERPPSGGLPITEAVTKWLQSQRPESGVVLDGGWESGDDSEGDAEEDTTGPKNGHGNPYLARCRNTAGLRVATDNERGVRAAAPHKWCRRHDATAANIIATAVRIGPLPCAVCCLIQ